MRLKLSSRNLVNPALSYPRQPLFYKIGIRLRSRTILSRGVFQPLWRSLRSLSPLKGGAFNPLNTPQVVSEDRRSSFRYNRKSRIKTALLLFSFSLYLNLSGCQNSLEPSFKEEDIPYFVKQICKDEYKLDVITERTETTLWVYVPLTKILHKDYGVKEGKILDEEMTDKLRNILSTVGRVVLSSNNAPEFFALWSSDINIGLDYILIGNVLDIKKAYAGSLPFTELNKRYVMKFTVNPEAIQDTVGRHLKFSNIRFPDFLVQQMVQRISVKFQEEALKKYFKVEKVDGIFNNAVFILEYSIKPLAKPDKAIDLMKEILNTVTYCIKIYEFQDFSRAEINDLVTQDKIVLNKAAILAIPMPVN